MSDFGKDDGPRKPRATFGDVMKGIPAGRPGEQRGHGDKPRDGQPPRNKEQRPPRPALQGGAPESEKPAERKGRAPFKREKPGSKPAPRPPVVAKGPEVVVVKKQVIEGTVGELKPTPRPVPPSLVYSRPIEEQQEEADDGSFAEMFARSDLKSTRGGVRPGAKVTAVIIQIGQDNAFLTLQEGGEAMIELRELQGEGLPEPRVGDRIEAYVVSVGGRAGGVVVSKGLAKGAANMGHLEAAKSGGMPVEGMVSGVNKGGLEVDLGGVRGFCPVSQIDVRFVENPAQFVGQKLQFRVSEIKEGDVVLSRRALLEAERAEAAEKTRALLVVGARLRGTVSSVRDFGAFVDLGGIEGMIHVSEMSHGRVTHPRDLLQQGQEVEVEITKIEAADPSSPDKNKHKERIGLSLRALEADPWAEVEQRFPLGARMVGKVVRLQPFGAFVELAPGIDGLIHVSNLSDKRITHPKEVVSEGQEVEVVVEKVDPSSRKIGLALWREGYSGPREPEPGEPTEGRPAAVAGRRPSVGDILDVTVDKVEPFGLFVSFAGGRGLVPNAEMGTPRGTDHKKLFPPGTVFKASLVEIDTQGRLRLSKTAVEIAQERAEVQAYNQQNQGKQKGRGFGTLGDLLKAKLQK